MTDTGTRWSEQERRLAAALHRAVDDAEPSAPAPTAPRPVAPPVDLGRRRRRWVAVAVPLVAACLVAAVVVGIGAATRDTPDPAATPTPAPVLQDPAVMVGTWSVTVAGHEDEDVSLRGGGDGVDVIQGACTLNLAWATHPDGLLVLDADRIILLSYGGNPCPPVVQAPWWDVLTSVAAFTVQDEDHVDWLDREGTRVATLVRRGQARAFAPSTGVAALPAAMVAPSREQLQGSWFEEGLGAAGRSIRFDEGTWTFSQSVPCNSRTQRYSLSATGGFATVPTRNGILQGCGARLPAWLPSDVSRLGLDGEVLVLLDAEGHQVARLDRGEGSSETLLDQVQGDWEPVGMTPSAPGDLWLRIDGEWLRHAFNAACNTADDELRLSGDGWVVGSRRAQAGGCEPGGEELLPGGVARVELVGDQLVVIGLGGDELRRFERAGTDTVLERAQGRWDLVSAWPGDRPMWLEVDGVNLTHAGNAGCNTDETGYRLASDGSVDETVDAYELLPEGTVSCQPGGPQLVQGRVGRIRLDGDQLVLIARTGSEIARFERADP